MTEAVEYGRRQGGQADKLHVREHYGQEFQHELPLFAYWCEPWDCIENDLPHDYHQPKEDGQYRCNHAYQYPGFPRPPLFHVFGEYRHKGRCEGSFAEHDLRVIAERTPGFS